MRLLDPVQDVQNGHYQDLYIKLSWLEQVYPKSSAHIHFQMIFLLIFLGNPIGTHILSKAAYKSGHHVWTLEEDAKEEKNHADLPH